MTKWRKTKHKADEDISVLLVTSASERGHQVLTKLRIIVIPMAGNAALQLSYTRAQSGFFSSAQAEPLYNKSCIPKVSLPILY